MKIFSFDCNQNWHIDFPRQYLDRRPGVFCLTFSRVLSLSGSTLTVLRRPGVISLTVTRSVGSQPGRSALNDERKLCNRKSCKRADRVPVLVRMTVSPVLQPGCARRLSPSRAGIQKSSVGPQTRKSSKHSLDAYAVESASARPRMWEWVAKARMSRRMDAFESRSLWTGLEYK